MDLCADTMNMHTSAHDALNAWLAARPRLVAAAFTVFGLAMIAHAAASEQLLHGAWGAASLLVSLVYWLGSPS